jgi:hypothetical protein
MNHEENDALSIIEQKDMNYKEVEPPQSFIKPHHNHYLNISKGTLQIRHQPTYDAIYETNSKPNPNPDQRNPHHI